MDYITKLQILEEEVENKNIIIRDVVLAEYEGIGEEIFQNDNNKVMLKRAQFKTVKVIDGVIVDNGTKIIDIVNHTLYNVLERTNSGKIKNNLTVGEIYPLYVFEKDWYGKDRVVLCSVLEKCIKLYEEYLHNPTNFKYATNQVKKTYFTTLPKPGDKLFDTMEEENVKVKKIR